MQKAHLIQSGHSQAVRLPRAFRFSGSEGGALHVGTGGLLLPIGHPWQTQEVGLAAFAAGFQLRREQPEGQPRQQLVP